jgi:hypothetical protein
MKGMLAVIAALLAASAASAQQAAKVQALPSITMQPGGGSKTGAPAGGSSAMPGAQSTMADLVSRGYEIKAAVPNGGKFVVFMQKDKSAYACEFSSLTDTRCGSLN